jgi:hypothetical protein
MNETKITLNFTKTTVDAVSFPVTTGDLKALAHGYFMDRLVYEYEAWAEGADFAPDTGEWFDYHFAGERLNAIQQILSPTQMKQAKGMAESTFLYNNRIDNDRWIEFKKAGNQ